MTTRPRDVVLIIDSTASEPRRIALGAVVRHSRQHVGLCSALTGAAEVQLVPADLPTIPSRTLDRALRDGADTSAVPVTGPVGPGP